MPFKPDFDKIKLDPEFVRAHGLGPQGRVRARKSIAVASQLMAGLSDKAKLRMAAKRGKGNV